MKKIICILITSALATWIFLPGCKKNCSCPQALNISIPQTTLPADDSSSPAVVLSYKTTPTCPYELELTNGELIVPGAVPVSDIVIYPNQWTNNQFTLQIRSSLIIDSGVLFIVKNPEGGVTTKQLSYVSQQAYDSWVFQYTQLLPASVQTIKANGADTAILTFNFNTGNGSIVPHIYQKNVQFFTNYGNFLTPPGALAKMAIIPIDYTGNAMVRLIADTLPDTAKIVAVFDNNPNLVKTTDVIFSPVASNISMSTSIAQAGNIVTITITSSHYFQNRAVVFKSDSGMFLYSPTGNTYNTVFDNTGTAQAFLKDTASAPSPPYYNYINASFLSGAYQLNDTIFFH